MGTIKTPSHDTAISSFPFRATNSTDLFINGVAYTPKTVVIAATTGGSPNTILAAVTGSVIRVIAMALSVSVADPAAVNLKSAATSISGPMSFAANGQLILPYMGGFPWFETAVSAALNMTVTGTSNTVSGTLVYVTYVP